MRLIPLCAALVAISCAAARASADVSCDEVRRGQELADRIVRRAEAADEAHAKPLYAEAAERYLELWQRFAEPCREAAHARFASMLYDAASWYRRAGLRGRSVAVLRILANPANRFDSSEAGQRALLEMGRDYQSIGAYDRAAGHYEHFVQVAPRLAEAPRALSDAIVLRLALGDDDKASESVRRFEVLFGRRQRDRVAELRMALAQHQLDAGRHDDAIDELERSLAARPRSPHLRIDALVLLGRAQAASGNPQQAQRSYAAALSLWPFGHPEKLGDVEPQRLGRTLNMIGEALFADGERLRVRADAIQLGTTQAGLDGGWRRREAAMRIAEQAYARILQLQPMPPPRWVTAASEAFAAMWDAAERELARQHPQAPQTTVAAQRARSAYQRCAAIGIRYQAFGAATLRCQAWLRDHSDRGAQRDEMLAPGLRTTVEFADSQPLADPR